MKDANLLGDMHNVLEYQPFIQSTLDALPAHIAILDKDGNILYVNASWRNFADANHLDDDDYRVGTNYLEVCDTASGAGSQGADEAANGIRQIISEELEEFSTSYGCHGPTEKRWFIIRVTRFESDFGPRIVVQHENITARRQAEEALNRRSHQLGERVKELNCLYSISKIIERPDTPLEETIQRIVDLIPPGWQYPKITVARVVLGEQVFVSDNFIESPWQQTNHISVLGQQVGQLQVYYLEEKPQQDEGPFIIDERHLITAITKHLEQLIERKQMDENLREREAQYRTLFKSSTDTIFLMKGDRFVDCNPSTLTMFGCSREQIINQQPHKFSPPYQPDGISSKEKALKYIQEALDNKPQQFEWSHIKANGVPFEAEVRLKRVDLRGESHILASLRDISERKRMDQKRKLNESRLNSILELSQKAHELSERDIVQHAIETAVTLTDSMIGYLHFVNPDQNTIQLVTWSEKTFEYCTIISANHYPLDEAGVWADCVRLGRSVIHNDYQTIPNKVGYPEGHAHLTRHASIPVYDREKISIILGVGNKSKEYDSSDVLQMNLVGYQLVRILQRKRFENDLRIKDSAIASAINAVAITNLDGKLNYVNAAFLRMWGYNQENEVLGRSAEDFWVYPEEVSGEGTTLHDLASWMGELVGTKKDGTHFDAQLSASLIHNEEGDPISMMASFINITERKRAEQELIKANALLETRLVKIEKLQDQLREQAIRDSLTGLFNRRYLEENMAQTIARADREKYPISLVMIDIDHFKVVNDTYGHKAGDEMLIALSNLLRKQIRKGDTICRYGGEEFVVMMPHASRKIALQRAEEWRGAFEKLQVPFDSKMLNTTLSAGIATLSPESNNIDFAMREADIALYRSKSEGRNRITVSEKLRG